MEFPALEALAQEWEEEAERIRERYGQEDLARICETHAVELRTRIREHLDQKLTLQEAAEESGYSVSHLQHLVADGEVPNAGRKGRPRIRRGDLPVKNSTGENSLGEAASPTTDTTSGRGHPTPEEMARDFLK